MTHKKRKLGCTGLRSLKILSDVPLARLRDKDCRTRLKDSFLVQNIDDFLNLEETTIEWHMV